MVALSIIGGTFTTKSPLYCQHSTHIWGVDFMTWTHTDLLQVVIEGERLCTYCSDRGGGGERKEALGPKCADVCLL